MDELFAPRHCKVNDVVYTFERLPPGHERIPKAAIATWQGRLDPLDYDSAIFVDEYQDGRFNPRAIPGAYSDFAGAAASEVTMRILYDRWYKTWEERKKLVFHFRIAVPGAALAGLIAGWLFRSAF